MMSQNVITTIATNRKIDVKCNAYTKSKDNDANCNTSRSSGGCSSDLPAVFLHTPLEEKGPWSPFYQLWWVLAKGSHLLEILLKALEGGGVITEKYHIWTLSLFWNWKIPGPHPLLAVI